MAKQRITPTTTALGGVTVVVLLAVAVAVLWPRRPADRVYRIGFENNAVYHFINRDGSMGGLTYEVISGAARQAGVRLEWVHRPESSEAALRAGAVDLWPMMADLPSRRRSVYFTSPWRQSEYYLVTRAGQPLPDAAYQDTIGFFPIPLHEQLTRLHFPHAKPVPFTTWDDGLSAICAGQISAGLFSGAGVERALGLQGSGCDLAGLRTHPVPGLQLSFAIASTFASRRAADRVRSGLESLARDGTLLPILARYSPAEAREVSTTFRLLETRQRERTLVTGLTGLTFALLVSLWLSWSLFRARKKAVAAEAAEADMLSRYTLAARASNDAIWDWHPATGSMEWNEGLQALFGYTPADREERADWKAGCCHPEDRAGVVAGLQAAIERRENHWSAEYRFRCRDGSYATVMDRAHLVYDASGAPIRIIGAMMDLTPRRKLEEQLRQSMKLEAVGRLAGGISHDFNNLLTVINGYSELALADLPAGDPRRTPLQEVANAGKRAAALTSQLLAFSRKQPIQPRSVDLNQILRESEKMLGRVLGEDVELVTRLSPSLGLITADPGQIHQVVMNLSVNARDAMPQGGRLVIETADVNLGAADPDLAPGAEPGPYVLLTVSDNGIGMDEDTRRHIFEPFYTTKAAGTGLGLASVYGIVQQSRGWITAVSEPGQGATFRIHFPRRADAAADAAPAPAAHPLRGDETILIVEDQSEVRSFLVAVLRRQGYEVLEAATPSDAVQIVDSQRGIDLLITDVVMPGMSGPQLADAVLQRRPDLRLLFVSGYTADRVMPDGGADILAKPFSPAELAGKVRQILDRRTS